MYQLLTRKSRYIRPLMTCFEWERKKNVSPFHIQILFPLLPLTYQKIFFIYSNLLTIKKKNAKHHNYYNIHNYPRQKTIILTSPLTIVYVWKEMAAFKNTFKTCSVFILLPMTSTVIIINKVRKSYKGKCLSWISGSRLLFAPESITEKVIDCSFLEYIL